MDDSDDGSKPMFEDWGYVQVEIRASALLRNFRGGGFEGGQPRETLKRSAFQISISPPLGLLGLHLWVQFPPLGRTNRHLQHFIVALSVACEYIAAVSPLSSPESNFLVTKLETLCISPSEKTHSS